MSVPEPPPFVFSDSNTAPSPHPDSTPRSQPFMWMGLWLSGVVVLVAGTFLPWVYSGRVAKSSYSITGSLERHLNLPSWAEIFVVGWPFIGPVCAVLVALFALGLRRTAAGVSALFLLLIGLLCLAILIVGHNASGLISFALIGPAVTLTGCTIALVAAVALTVKNPSRRPSSTSVQLTMR